MLNKIEIKKVFAHDDTKITFTKGLTRLHGENEKGKSQVFEMIRWALFGSKALRTSAEDYKGGTVILTFNDDYVVTRTIGNATLYKGKELLARSTTAVNKKIIEIIGYGLKTFDNVNSIQQGEVEKLTKLKAEDRKKFLDELIGAAQIDSLITDYKTELSITTAELKAAEGLIVNAILPETPDVATLEEIEKQLDEKAEARADLRLQERRVEQLEADMQKIMITPDHRPESTIEELEKEIVEAATLDAATKKARVEYPSIARLYDMGAREVDVAKLKSDVAAVVALREARVPSHTTQQVHDFLLKHKANDAHIEVKRLQAEFEAYEACPGLEIQRGEIVLKINELLPVARPHSGLPSVEALKESLEHIKDFEAATKKLKKIESPYAQSFSGEVDFSQAKFDEIVALLDTPVPNMIDLYNAINAKQKASEVEEKRNRLEEEKKLLDPIAMQTLDADISQLREARTVRQRYDADLRYYREAMDKNAATQTKIDTKRKEQAETANVVKALQGFKYYINTYFLPSVSKAASAMLVTMTNGKRKRITITDKFEITVDHQQVEAMSGSTKAIINIALRFALQFVLTKNSFSVFMADEIDGAMDENRAKYLNESMAGMTEHIGQVIVISHKDIVAPNNIKL